MYLEINIESGIPIYLQIAGQTRQMAASGELAPGEKLPSVRSLAVKLRINPNTVQAAYRHLEAEGIVETRQGLGVFLCSTVKKMSAREKSQAVGSILDQAILKAHQLGLEEGEVLRLLKERSQTFRTRAISRAKEGGSRNE
jgi:GntR family transcriptional regulator